MVRQFCCGNVSGNNNGRRGWCILLRAAR
jgi:hypothetical protein